MKVDLGIGTSLVLHEKCVVTHYADGLQSSAWREITLENLDQAQEQGYDPTPDGVWISLAEHEAFHTLVARVVYNDRESPVLRQAAGSCVYLPYWRRLHEEAVVLALQLFLNTGNVTAALDPWVFFLEKPAKKIRQAIKKGLL